LFGNAFVKYGLIKNVAKKHVNEVSIWSF